MNVFDLLTMIGGLCLFLFGMDIMGQALERRAGNSLRTVLSKLTTKKIAGLLTGVAVTSVIQSSGATTVMVVGFVNSGLMTLGQAINVIMGANIGTTVTAWILSLGGIESSNFFVQLLKPTSFTPMLALVGIVYYMFCKDSKKKDTGAVFLGFATLMFGMDTMSNAVKGLADIPQFAEIFLMFKNPILGVIAGAILTGIIQSSSVSVGILQALAVTGKVSYAAAIPIIMGQNIGACVTTLISSVGASKQGKCAALVHLFFNVIGTVVVLILFVLIRCLLTPVFLDKAASMAGIAIVHSLFNIVCTILLYPMSGFLEKLVVKLVPNIEDEEKLPKLDERLLQTPPVALEVSRNLTIDMAKMATKTLKEGIMSYDNYSDKLAEIIRKYEAKSDKYEDILGTYLVKLSEHQVGLEESLEIAKLLKIIGDLERISDHSLNLLESAEEMKEKNIVFSSKAEGELKVLFAAVDEILDMTLNAFQYNDLEAASNVEPLEHTIDKIKRKLRNSHILRLQNGECTMEAGFIWSDFLTNLERVSDHCSNIAGCITESMDDNLNVHEAIRESKTDNPEYKEKCKKYWQKYMV